MILLHYLSICESKVFITESLNLHGEIFKIEFKQRKFSPLFKK